MATSCRWRWVYSAVISNVYDYYHKVDDPWGTIHEAFATVARRNIQNKTIDDALLNKQQIEAEILPDFRELVKKYEVGVEIREVRIQNIAVPKEVDAAYRTLTTPRTRRPKSWKRLRNTLTRCCRPRAPALIR